mmetsp:Transcript_12092/g.19519  ORF Transcript_12092/g.19519 Transcript_12092/m.19519 type:complete len:363 (-) Transcript_12092:4-1092(-)
MKDWRIFLGVLLVATVLCVQARLTDDISRPDFADYEDEEASFPEDESLEDLAGDEDKDDGEAPEKGKARKLLMHNPRKQKKREKQPVYIRKSRSRSRSRSRQRRGGLGGPDGRSQSRGGGGRGGVPRGRRQRALANEDSSVEERGRTMGRTGGGQMRNWERSRSAVMRFDGSSSESSLVESSSLGGSYSNSNGGHQRSARSHSRSGHVEDNGPEVHVEREKGMTDEDHRTAKMLADMRSAAQPEKLRKAHEKMDKMKRKIASLQSKVDKHEKALKKHKANGDDRRARGAKMNLKSANRRLRDFEKRADAYVERKAKIHPEIATSYRKAKKEKNEAFFVDFIADTAYNEQDPNHDYIKFQFKE